MQEGPIGALIALFGEIKQRARAERLSTEQTAALEETLTATAQRLREILYPDATQVEAKEPAPIAARRAAGKK